MRIIALLALAALGVGAFAMSALGRTVWQFALGARVELRKVVWPTIAETRKTTLVVDLVREFCRRGVRVGCVRLDHDVALARHGRALRCHPEDRRLLSRRR